MLQRQKPWICSCKLVTKLDTTCIQTPRQPVSQVISALSSSTLSLIRSKSSSRIIYQCSSCTSNSLLNIILRYRQSIHRFTKRIKRDLIKSQWNYWKQSLSKSKLQHSTQLFGLYYGTVIAKNSDHSSKMISKKYKYSLVQFKHQQLGL